MAFVFSQFSLSPIFAPNVEAISQEGQVHGQNKYEEEQLNSFPGNIKTSIEREGMISR